MAETNILVVEDEGIVAEDIGRSLQNLGYTVSTVVWDWLRPMGLSRIMAALLMSIVKRAMARCLLSKRLHVETLERKGPVGQAAIP